MKDRRIKEIVKCGIALSGKNIKPVLSHAYDKVKQDLIESMKKITLDSMVEEFHLMLRE